MNLIWEELTQKWINHLKIRGLSPHTVLAYGDDMCGFARFYQRYFGYTVDSDKFVKLDRIGLRAWLSSMHDQGLSVASRKRSLAAIKNLTRYMMKNKEWNFNSKLIDHPALITSGPKLAKRLPRPLTGEQINSLNREVCAMAAQPWIEARNLAFITLLYATGLRISEGLGINLNQWLSHNDFLNILGKGKKVRAIPILPIVKVRVNQYLKLCPYHMKDNDLIFKGEQGKPLRACVVQKIVRECRAVLGLPDTATPHSLRHSCASHLLESSDDLRSIQELLGHASLSSTQVYTQVALKKLVATHGNAHPRSKIK